MSQHQEKFYPETKFGGFAVIDGTIAFYNIVNSLLDPNHVVLDVGCGRGEYAEDMVTYRRNLRIVRGKVHKVIGIDVDPNAQSNPFIDEFHLIQGESWPLPDNSIDVLICDNVLEHIENVEPFFVEVSRVLVYGGVVCMRTTNRHSYVALAARLTPKKYYNRVVLAAQEPRKEEDIFPAFYKCNTVAKLKKLYENAGLEGVVFCHESEPRYFEFSRVAYFFGVLHQRFAPGFLKPTIFAFGRLKVDG